MKKRRIKHNDLLPWFIRDHGTLPGSYLRSCEKFFKELSVWKKQLLLTDRTLSKNKPQASRLTINNNRIIKDYENK
jgi:hypothetical protein